MKPAPEVTSSGLIPIVFTYDGNDTNRGSTPGAVPRNNSKIYFQDFYHSIILLELEYSL